MKYITYVGMPRTSLGYEGTLIGLLYTEQHIRLQPSRNFLDIDSQGYVKGQELPK